MATMKVKEVTTRFKLEDEVINGYQVSAEVEVYNENQGIIRINGTMIKVDENGVSGESFVYSVVRSVGKEITPSTIDPEKKMELFSIGMAFEERVKELISQTVLTSIEQ